MAGEVLLLMLDGGFHHAPVLDATGAPIGVVTDTDLLGLGKHAPFALKSSIERAADRDSAVAGRARTARRRVLAGRREDGSRRRRPHRRVHDRCAHATAHRPRRSSVTATPPVPWAWLALGSAARQEQALHTDQDHALAYDLQGRTREEVDPYFADLAEFVTAGLEDAGIPRCDGDAMAANSALRKSIEGWTDAYKGVDDRSGRGGKRAALDRLRLPPGDGSARRRGTARRARSARARLYPNFLHHLSRRALDEKPPTGFLKDLVVESKGQHAGRLDIKHKGITIVGNLARAASIGAGLTEKRTIGRLRAAADAGAIDDGDAGRARRGVPVPLGRPAQAPGRSRPRRRAAG